MADLFTDEEEKQLSEQAQVLSDTMKMEAVIVTTEENPDSAQVFADGFYMEGGFGTGSDHSGILFLIDMDNRELYISTNGQMIRYMTDSRINDVLDDVYNYAADADYYGAAAAFLTDTEKCYSNGISRDQYNYDTETGKISRYRSITVYEAIGAAVIALLCGGGFAAAVLGSYRLKRKTYRYPYESQAKVHFTRRDDQFLHRSITQRRIPRDPPSGGGGGGGSRSSTHTSSSGTSHGGGGRSL